MYVCNQQIPKLEKMKTDLSVYDNSWYHPGRIIFIRLLWLIVNTLVLQNPLNFSSSLKVIFLKLFGAKIGKKVVIKPAVNVKYPWRLSIGDFSWVGENVWIDNLDDIVIGKNCCISQGALLLCGNHNYKKPTFDLIIGKISLGDGCWIGAKAVVCPGVNCGEHAVLSVNSVATSNLEAFGIYQGNPAIKVKERVINS